MERKRILRIMGGLVVIAALLLAACGGGAASNPTPQGNTATDNGQTMNDDQQPEATMADTSDGGEAAASSEFPDILVLPADATDVEINAAAGQYVYVVPMMVADTIAYLQTELEAKGWQPLGQPTIMGHLATLNMQMDKSRVTISMQDNDLSQTTRVQMLLLEQ
jgi:hypothetical protein